MYKPKRGLPLPSNDFPRNLWISIIAAVFLLGILGGYTANELFAQNNEPEPTRSEVITRAEIYPLGQTGYQLKVFPFNTNQNSRNMLRIELWHTLTNGYEAIIGSCFTQGGSMVGPTDIDNVGRYHDDWEFRIDRSINDAYGSISIPLPDAEDIVTTVFSCST